MADELKDSGTVTAISVVGFVFGIIGMLGSFIPCIGSLAFYIGIPAAIISGIALAVAYSQKAKRTFAIVAVTISLIGVVISGWQYFSIISAGQKAKQALEQMARSPMTTASTRTAQESRSTSSQAARPAQTGPQVAIIQTETGKENAEEARKIFKQAYVTLLGDNNFDKVWGLRNDANWKTLDITLLRGAKNFLKVEGPKYGVFILFYNKNIQVDENCSGNFVPGKTPIKPEDSKTQYWASYDDKDEGPVCRQYTFEPYHTDVKLELLVPTSFQHDYKISLRDAEIVK